MEQKITLSTNDLYTPSQAAEYLGVTTMTVWRWAKAGKLHPIVIGHSYFHINELEQVRDRAQ